jgi:hypothetical protein
VLALYPIAANFSFNGVVAADFFSVCFGFFFSAEIGGENHVGTLADVVLIVGPIIHCVTSFLFVVLPCDNYIIRDKPIFVNSFLKKK